MALLTPSNLKMISFNLNGLEEYLKKIQAAGRNIDSIVPIAVRESGKPVAADIWEWASKHEFTGETLEGVTLSDVKCEGNRFYVDVGIDTTKAKLAWHAVFVEYGTPTNEADPGISEAFKDNRSKIIKIQKEILKKAGVPVD